jgi:hypothetical protein
VMDGSNSPRMVRRGEQISRKLGLGFYSTARQGALVLQDK